MESKSYVNHWDNSISLRQSKFIEKAKSIHNNKYDYSKVVYKNIHHKVCIICPEHGEFYQDPASHLKGCGCPECGNKKIWETQKKYTTEYIISLFKNTHKDKYDYSKVNYIDSQTKVCVICPEHGEFWILSSHHIKGVNCPKCMGNAKYTTNSWISKAKEIHNSKYDYSKVDYVNGQTKVCIICPKHGEFWQKPQNHLENHGCPYCYNEKRHHQKKALDKEKFIQRANKIHNNKYDYSKVEYINYHTKVCIICPKHGEFWQTPANHIFGSGKGCPQCNDSKLELLVEKFLKNNGISYIKEKTFGWLKYNNYMFLDFYLPEYNIGIECQGKQHFNPIEYFGGNDAFESTRDRDILKQKLCKEHNIEILYYTDIKLEEYPYDVITDLNELIKKIKCY